MIDVVFAIRTPEGSGACPSGFAPVYRLYNNGQGGAPNHRLTACTNIRDRMIEAGICGGMDLGWNLKRGGPEISIDFLVHRSNGQDIGGTLGEKVMNDVKAGRLRLPKDSDLTVEIVQPDGSLFPFTGRITFADPSYNPQTGTFLLAPGFEAGAALIDELQQHVRGKLAPYEYPKEIEFIDQLPMTTTGKIIRGELRRREISKNLPEKGSSRNT